ncbi:MAG: NAD-dependent epimerase/dehydratase family protein [Verrucomicrobia bacterium]|nr:NAD-dependent epimerase/dehydratase family protein [Verrucomicrobiota bacterium]
MKVLISGICGFVGSALARHLAREFDAIEIFGIDSLIRPGAYLNLEGLEALGCKAFQGDIRNASDVEVLPAVDWVIDAAANPKVLAGVDGQTSSRQLLEHNLNGTINLLERCRQVKAGFLLLSTSRVYSIPPLAALPLRTQGNRFALDSKGAFPQGISENGLAEDFSTAPPVSLYGATKLASEVLALEYGAAFGFPVWIDRCGVLAGARQFGTAEQGIFSYWVHAWVAGRPLRYLGFSGLGHQVRDAFHPTDLAELVAKQLLDGSLDAQERIWNLGGGPGSSMSLAELSEWCAARFGPREVSRDLRPRTFDLPWVIMDSRAARQRWEWRGSMTLPAILDEIAAHAERHPHWLEICRA